MDREESHRHVSPGRARRSRSEVLRSPSSGARCTKTSRTWRGAALLALTAFAAFQVPSLLLTGESSADSVLDAFHRRSPADAVAELEARFPELERLQVTELRVAPDCEYLVYRRGAFIGRPDGAACASDLAGARVWEPFDVQARADLDALVRRAGVFGRRIVSASVQYDAEGHVGRGSFNRGGTTEYVLARRHDALTGDEYEIVTPIDADWYAVSSY